MTEPLHIPDEPDHLPASQPAKPRRTGAVKIAVALAAGALLGGGITAAVAIPVANNTIEELEADKLDLGQRLNTVNGKKTKADRQIERIQADLDEEKLARAEAEKRLEGIEEREAELAAAEKEAQEKKEAEEKKEQEAAEERQANTKDGDGYYLVGEDIQPGTWRSSGTEFCYWARLSGTSGETRDIITNGLDQSSVVVTIAASDVAFETKRCGTWTKIN